MFIQADSNLPYTLKSAKPDICVNIAEGLGGDVREAQTPAMLEMLKIPYTGSRVLANAIALDKTLTKRIWRDRRLPVAPFQEFYTGDEPLRPEMRYPLFVKPAREGTGMGVDAMLYSNHPEWYDPDGFHRFPILELDSSRSITPGVYGLEAKAQSIGSQGAPGYICPSILEPELAKKLQHYAWRAHNIIGALDVSRIDIRLDSEGQPCLMEINPLPGLTPDYSDLCLITKAAGISYTDLILEILYLGASRYGMIEPNELAPLLQKKRGAPAASRANGK